jgi:pimeloyl-ACP methyl ester carboxylesterase
MMPLLVILAGTIALGLLYQLLGTWRDARTHSPPGKLIRVAGSRLHIRTSGQGSPAVVLESGIAASSVSWTAVQAALSSHTTVSSYDRAGLGWSEPNFRPRTPSQLADELHELLVRAGLAPPFVLVGHSFGGLVVRAFAARYPRETAGLVLVDALHHSEWLNPTGRRRRMLRGGVWFSWLGAALASVGVVRLCLDLLTRGARRTPRAVMKSFGKDVAGLITRMVGEVTKLPPEVWPAIRAHWSRPRSFATMARYLAALPKSSAEFLEASPLPPVPLVVLSADCTGDQLAAQKDLSLLCAGGECRVVHGCGHWIHLDRPDAVVEAVIEMLERVRQEFGVRHGSS